MGRYSVFKYYERALPDSLCDWIIEAGKQLPGRDASLRPVDGDDYVDTNIRKTNIAFWDTKHWVGSVLEHYARMANEEVWGYDLIKTESVQFGEYSEGGTYSWHKDEFDLPYDETVDPAFYGLSRKISVVVNLSDPEDYGDGDLVFKDTYGELVDDPGLQTAMKQRGTVIVFPAYILHTVTPVSRGIRHSLVSWMIGQPFV